MTYKIGTRVRKVRGIVNIGATGVVDCGPSVSGRTLSETDDCNIYVRQDSPWVDIYGRHFPARTVSLTRDDLWEPILDRHEPCESDFKESLDKLLSEVSREAV